ncbi:hypothetical protein [Sphingomonas mucosissima]|uniref:Uncharacterized protein n=1 Tax=Sphingomonas mucosissima TaxID=370959 RepID=A0A245ZEZ0_9SPHN|nr:hypothetical protein [Sphingomonas mucosissima]OWK28316.1 hypothetical protein SPMU_31720 [Sphingomonas mucosissima]
MAPLRQALLHPALPLRLCWCYRNDMFSHYVDASARASWAAIAATLSLAASTLGGCDRRAPDPVTTNAQSETARPSPTPAAPAISAPSPALTRSDLIAAANQAASAYAGGEELASPDPLVGRNFAVRLPFGCKGPAPNASPEQVSDGLASWAWGADQKTIRLRMMPGDWTRSATLGNAGSAEWEAVEGFWIPRPWSLAETCPSIKADPLQTDVPAASAQTLGIAAVFDAGGSRLGRRNGRAYEYVIRSAGDDPLPAPKQGFRMLLEGRVSSFPSRRAVECRAPGPDQRPVCIIAVQLDRVAYEDAEGGTLSEWRPG